MADVYRMFFPFQRELHRLTNLLIIFDDQDSHVEFPFTVLALLQYSIDIAEDIILVYVVGGSPRNSATFLDVIEYGQAEEQ